MKKNFTKFSSKIGSLRNSLKKKARLEALSIEVPLNFLDFYFDYDFVKFDVDKLLTLYEKLYEKDDEKEIKETKNSRGFCYHLNYYIGFNKFINFYLIYLSPSLKEGIDKLVVKAHEETHFLDEYGKLDILENKIKENCNRDISFSSINDKEVKAFIGSLYALESRGMINTKSKNFYDADQIFRILNPDGTNKDLTEAWWLYFKL